MKYSVGQVVVVSNPSTLYTEQFRGTTGIVTALVPDDQFAYELTFRSGQALGFAEEEISLVSPEPSEELKHDAVDHPSHYTWLPNGLEVIDITQHFNFNLGNALKYIMRAGRKGDAAEDLKKAARYLEFELNRMEAAQ
ncbi:DUF3310 domain-containing protein [Streptomyces sp. NPDC002698]|uniref:DUF3310 domain-containing protein n=1 Tax=Streptomyces sp. NPDC002698 TaxID=3364660 RepID=UPI003677BC5D